MGLPDPCEECSPYGGNFQYSKGGMKRCQCARGQSLAEMDRMRAETPLLEVEPVVSPEAATQCISMLTAIRYFPAEPGARLLVADEIRAMCNSDDEAFWLCKRLARLYSEWPGIPAMRAVFCSKYVPLDRFASVGMIPGFPEGIPPELPQAGPTRLALPPGHVASVDEGLDRAVQMLANIKDLNRPLRRQFAKEAREVPNPNFTPVTQADIERAVNELRDKRAREALGLHKLPDETA